MNPSLSICVPAYNRLRYLPELVASVEAQWTEGVEMCVSDNGSTDGSAEWLAQQSARLPWLRWESRGANVGPDRNYLFAVGMARERHAWLMGSDDAVAPGGIGKVAEVLARHDPDVVLTERVLCGPDLQEWGPQKVWRFPEKERVVTLDREASAEWLCAQAESIVGAGSYLSSLLLRRTVWEDTPMWLPAVGDAYPHVFLMLNSLDGSRSILATKIRPVLARLGNDSFYTASLRNRLELDWDGYRAIFSELFSAESAVHESLRVLLSRGHLPSDLRAAVRWRCSMSPEDWADLKAWLHERYGPSTRMSIVRALPETAIEILRAMVGRRAKKALRA